MRFIWNLVSDYDGNDTPAIRSIGAMQAAINLINKIHNPLDIYNELKIRKKNPQNPKLTIVLMKKSPKQNRFLQSKRMQMQ